MMEETQPKTWQEKIAKQFWSIKAGERAENLRQASRRFNNVESLVMSTREKLLGKEITDNNRPEGEDMHIGDDNSVIHQYLSAEKKGTASTIAKLTLGAGMLAMGAGVPIGGWLIADALKNKSVKEVVIPIDSDTLFDLELVK